MGVYIDIALSLIFIFLVLSLVVSAVNELISMWLGMRPAILAKSIISIIDDEKLRAQFYAAGSLVNPRLAAEGQKQDSWTEKDAAKSVWRRVGWIFPTRGQTKGHPSFIDGATFAQALTVGALKQITSDGKLNVHGFDNVKEAVEQLPKSQIREVMISALSRSDKKLEVFQAEIEAWFDRAQDRVSGEYTRWAKLITLLIGGLLVCATNADTVRIAHELKSDADARTALAESIVEAYAPDSGSPIHITCEVVDPDGKLKDEEKAAKKQECLIGRIAETKTVLDGLGPNLVGWGNDPIWREGLVAPAGFMTTLGNLINKLLGLIITVFAITLGAPFWFDLLGKIVNIRAAGVKPASTSGSTP